MPTHAVISCATHIPSEVVDTQRMLCGVPVWRYVAEKLLDNPQIARVWVDSCDLCVIHGAEAIGVTVIPQPPEHDDLLGHDLFKSTVNRVDAVCRNEGIDIPTTFVWMLTTHPFISELSVNVGISAVTTGRVSSAIGMGNHSDVDTLCGGMCSIPNYDVRNTELFISTPLYVSSGDYARGNVVTPRGNPHVIPFSPMESVCMDDVGGEYLAQTVANGIRTQDNLRLNGQKPLLSSAAICEVLDTVGEKNYLVGELRTRTRSFFGRAITLEVGKIHNDCSVDYTLQNIRDHFGYGDVLVLKGRSDLACFNELDAHFSLRAGISGVCIEGKVRDAGKIARMGLSVASDGDTPVGYGGNLGVKKIGYPLSVHGVSVRNGDLIFCDGGGCVRIPREIEDEVVQCATRIAMLDREEMMSS